jgi:hypothetical protein
MHLQTKKNTSTSADSRVALRACRAVRIGGRRISIDDGALSVLFFEDGYMDLQTKKKTQATALTRASRFARVAPCVSMVGASRQIQASCLVC